MKDPDNLRDSTNVYGVNFTGSSSIKSIDFQNHMSDNLLAKLDDDPMSSMYLAANKPHSSIMGSS